MQINTIKEKYNTEVALIILCCRAYIQTADTTSINLYLQGNTINWKLLNQLSTAHRIRPVVYKMLHPHKDLIPAEYLAELRNFTIYFNAFALSNKRELQRILDILRQNSINAKPFKGVDFAETIYGDIGVREFSDNDIIIDEADIKEVISIMTTEGYYSKDSEFFNKFPKQYIRDYKDLFFEKRNGIIREFAFEFHFKPTRYYQGYNFSFADILGDDFNLKNKKFDVDQYLKLITINNGLMDCYPNLRSILDLAVTLRKLGEPTIYYHDSVLNDFINHGRMISVELLSYPENSTERNPKNYYSNEFRKYILETILRLQESRRISLSKYIYFRIKIADSLRYKLIQARNYVLLFVRPNFDDFMTLKLPFYSLYYFTKPFRILIKVFQGKFK